MRRSSRRCSPSSSRSWPARSARSARPGTVNAIFRIGDELYARLPRVERLRRATCSASASGSRASRRRYPCACPSRSRFGRPGRGLPVRVGDLPLARGRAVRGHARRARRARRGWRWRGRGGVAQGGGGAAVRRGAGCRRRGRGWRGAGAAARPRVAWRRVAAARPCGGVAPGARRRGRGWRGAGWRRRGRGWRGAVGRRGRAGAGGGGAAAAVGGVAPGGGGAAANSAAPGGSGATGGGDGAAADGVVTDERVAAAELARFVRALRAVPVPNDAPRGGRRPLRELDAMTRGRDRPLRAT